MTTMLDVPLDPNGAWTLIAASPITNVLVVGPSNGWAIYVGATAPAISTEGLPVTALDGSFSSSGIATGENLYGRPFGNLAGRAVSVRGIVN